MNQSQADRVIAILTREFQFELNAAQRQTADYHEALEDIADLNAHVSRLENDTEDMRLLNNELIQERATLIAEIDELEATLRGYQEHFDEMRITNRGLQHRLLLANKSISWYRKFYDEQQEKLRKSKKRARSGSF